MFNGKVHCKNVCGFTAFCLVYFLIQNLAFVMMWTANLAGLNIGVVTVIWAINPALLACVEYFVFGTKPQIAHAFGILCMIACSVLLALSHPSKKDMVPAVVEPWMPVLFALLASVFLTIHPIITKFLVGKRRT